MNAFHKTLFAAGLALAVLPGLGIAAQPAAPQPGQNQDMNRRLEEARARLERASAEVAELSRQLGRNFVYRLNTDGAAPPPRSLLGVVVMRGGQKDGAQVSSVSPGGAAEEAGIKVGDIITSIGGQDLTSGDDPSRALVERMSQIEPNQKIQVGALRDGKKMSFDVTPRPAPAPGIAPFEGMPALGNLVRGPQGPVGPDLPSERRIEVRTVGEGPDDGARFAGVEFATLSEKLGSYFGVKSGVLVVRAGGNAAFKLQDGDVILAIDGREPTSAQHAGRILRSYGNGEKLKLRVHRDRKAQDIEITMPNVAAGERRTVGDAYVPPREPRDAREPGQPRY